MLICRYMSILLATWVRKKSEFRKMTVRSADVSMENVNALKKTENRLPHFKLIFNFRIFQGKNHSTLKICETQKPSMTGTFLSSLKQVIIACI